MVNRDKAFETLEEMCREQGGRYREGTTGTLPSASCVAQDGRGQTQRKVGINHDGDEFRAYVGVKDGDYVAEFNISEMDPESVCEFGDQIMSDNIQRTSGERTRDWFKLANNGDRF